MKTLDKNYSRASFAFLCCICFCGFLNYILLTFLDKRGIFNTRQTIGLFCIYFFQVQTALVSIYYGYQLLRTKKDSTDWHYTDELTPDALTDDEKPMVIFFTIDGCLFNGIYNAVDKKFHGYDGLDFPLDEIFMWCFQNKTLGPGGKMKTDE